MHGYITYPQADGVVSATASEQANHGHGAPTIAVVTQGVKLADETRGYTRFRFLSDLLVRQGFNVELITSSFQHWDKAQRDLSNLAYASHAFKVHFIKEPGYKRNLDLGRIRSHKVFAKGLREYLEGRLAKDPAAYSLIYCEIPPNDMALVCTEVAASHSIPCVLDINDLWPEAMRMAVDIPVISDIAFAPFSRDAKKAYRLLTAAVGTSDEYASRPGKDRKTPYVSKTVYVGNQLRVFDEGAASHGEKITAEKSPQEFWVTYAGNLGASYDLATLVKAAQIASRELPSLRLKILGDGPDRQKLEALAAQIGAPVDFIGYAPYDLMAAYLKASDVTINSLIKAAPQSIVTKIGDYLAAGIPMINTGSSPEFCAKVEKDGFGVNVIAEDEEALAKVIVDLAANEDLRLGMGQRARRIAEEQFDQEKSYLAIVDLIRSLIG